MLVVSGVPSVSRTCTRVMPGRNACTCSLEMKLPCTTSGLYMVSAPAMLCVARLKRLHPASMKNAGNASMTKDKETIRLCDGVNTNMEKLMHNGGAPL